MNQQTILKLFVKPKPREIIATFFIIVKAFEIIFILLSSPSDSNYGGFKAPLCFQ